MERMRKIGCGLLAAVLVLCLAACATGKSAGDKLVGTWQRELVFLPYFNAQAELVLELKQDGTYRKTVINHESKQVLDMEQGTWSFDGVQLSCVKDKQSATAKYDYDPATNTLENAGYEYQKIS